ncbi:hypothetical protein [Kaistella sp.]|uniref:hypothetical protein n=1 Tax=Kaistella sp. TaxID=2782235 RepID=UPI003C624087
MPPYNSGFAIVRDFAKFKDFRYSEDYLRIERFVILSRTIAKPQNVTCHIKTRHKEKLEEKN